MTQAMSDRGGSAGYIAMERVVGTLHGRTGAFVLQHNALGDRHDRMLNIVVVPDTATGELVCPGCGRDKKDCPGPEPIPPNRCSRPAN